jgi:hypothetical protein
MDSLLFLTHKAECAIKKVPTEFWLATLEFDMRRGSYIRVKKELSKATTALASLMMKTSDLAGAP